MVIRMPDVEAEGTFGAIAKFHWLWSPWGGNSLEIVVFRQGDLLLKDGVVEGAAVSYHLVKHEPRHGGDCGSSSAIKVFRDPNRKGTRRHNELLERHADSVRRAKDLRDSRKRGRVQ